MMTMTRAALAALFVLLVAPIAWPEEAGASAACTWSSVWPEVKGQFPPLPKEAKLTGAKHKKGSIHRPTSDVPRSIRGVWTLELVVDEKGDVRDARIVSTPTIDPPWPEYEEAVLKSVKKWKYSPVRVDGRPWPNCTTVTVRDR